MKFISPPYSRI